MNEIYTEAHGYNKYITLEYLLKLQSKFGDTILLSFVHPLNRSFFKKLFGIHEENENFEIK